MEPELEHPENHLPEPNRVKLFFAQWGCGVIWLGIVAYAIWCLRAFIPRPPEPLYLSLFLVVLFVWFSETGRFIAIQNNSSEWNRPRAFRDPSMSFVGCALFLVELGIGLYFLWQSWRWLIFVLVLNALLCLSSVVRNGCEFIFFLLYIYFIKLRR